MKKENAEDDVFIYVYLCVIMLIVVVVVLRQKKTDGVMLIDNVFFPSKLKTQKEERTKPDEEKKGDDCRV